MLQEELIVRMLTMMMMGMVLMMKNENKLRTRLMIIEERLINWLG